MPNFSSVPKQDQKAGVIDDPMQVFLELVMIPANELIAWRAHPGSCAKPQKGDQLIIGINPIT